MATALHISFSAEKLFEVGDLAITNSIFTSLIVAALLITFSLAVRSQLDTKTKRPTGLQNFAELIIESLFGLVYSVTGNTKKARSFFPFIATFFLFIFVNNYFGLLPGVGTIGISQKSSQTEKHAGVDQDKKLDFSSIIAKAQASETIEEATDHKLDSKPENHNEGLPQTEENQDHATSQQDAAATTGEHGEETTESGHAKFVPIFRPGTADLNTTLALGIISIFMTQVFGVGALGAGYFRKFFDFSSPISFYVGLLELVSEFAKILSFAFRLFGNIFAGEVLLVVIGSLMPIIAPMPFYGLELFVGFIQALVFSMLSLVFFNMATQSHHEEH